MRTLIKYKDNFSIFIFFFFLTLIFFFEGSGISYGREISLKLIFVMPLFLFFINIFNKKEVIVPFEVTVLFVLFVIFSTISTVFSVNIQNSIEFLMFYISSFLIFLYIYNHQHLSGLIILFIYIISFVFLIYSLFINYLLPTNWNILIPNRGYQFVYAYFKTHNPIGPLLLIPLVYSIYQYIFLNKAKHMLLALILLPFLYLSYSRSSYLALSGGVILILCLKYIKEKEDIFSKKTLFAFLILMISFFLFIVVVKSNISLPFFKSINKTLSNHSDLNQKTFFGNRDQYFSSAIKSIHDHPFFGVGPGNVDFSTRKYASKPLSSAETADNIVLELLTENGIIAGTFFILILFLIIKRSRPDQREILIIFATMLMLFQTDSSQRYHSYFLLFMVLAGLIYKEDNILDRYRITVFAALFPYILAACIFFNQFLFNQKLYKQAFVFYPFDKKTHEQLILNSLFEDDALIDKYYNLYKQDKSSLIFLAGVYLKLNETEKALSVYRKINKLDPYDIDSILIRHYLESNLTDNTTGKNTVDNLLANIEKTLNLKENKNKYYYYRMQFKDACRIIYNQCPYKI